MARIQQKSSGRRVKREKLDAQAIKDSLKTALQSRGLVLPRFGDMSLRRPGPPPSFPQ